MPKRKNGREKLRKELDKVFAKMPSNRQRTAVRDSHSEKKVRGRPRKIPLSWVTGRAYNHAIQLKQVWPRLEAPLLAAQTVEEVQTAFENCAQPYTRDFVPERAADILVVLRDPKFPKRPEARIHFLADSLGGRPKLSLRTSRDICEKERARQRRKSQHHILRREFYIECSCGYKGPARDNACRKCGAEIPFSLHELMGTGPF
jgi:hypothetical protein